MKTLSGGTSEDISEVYQGGQETSVWDLSPGSSCKPPTPSEDLQAFCAVKIVNIMFIML